MHKHERQIRMWLDNSSVSLSSFITGPFHKPLLFQITLFQYQNPPQTLREIINVLNEYKGLMAKCEPYGKSST